MRASRGLAGGLATRQSCQRSKMCALSAHPCEEDDSAAAARASWIPGAPRANHALTVSITASANLTQRRWALHLDAKRPGCVNAAPRLASSSALACLYSHT